MPYVFDQKLYTAIVLNNKDDIFVFWLVVIFKKTVQSWLKVNQNHPVLVSTISQYLTNTSDSVWSEMNQISCLLMVSEMVVWICVHIPTGDPRDIPFYNTIWC